MGNVDVEYIFLTFATVWTKFAVKYISTYTSAFFVRSDAVFAVLGAVFAAFFDIIERIKKTARCSFIAVFVVECVTECVGGVGTDWIGSGVAFELFI